MRRIKSLLLATSFLAAATVSANAEINVVTSIKPVHSLVAAVMADVAIPGLIIDGAGSPHTYSMKPSKAQMLQDADVVFWIDHTLEAFLEKPIEVLGEKAKEVSLLDAHDLTKLEFREGENFEKHDHDDHDDHAHGAFDPHIWLDPVNAKAIVHEIEETLIEADPANKEAYEANAEAVMTKLDGLTEEVTKELEPIKDRKFIVFHDAYQYFEKRFGLAATGSITLSPEVMPGAERVAEIKKRLEGLKAACVFAEPQFEPKLIATVIEGTNAKSGVIDPLGANLENGPELYFNLIRNMAASFKDCLTPQG